MSMDSPADAPLTDKELVTRARAGDRSAFEQLVNQHHGTVYAIALAHLRNVDSAEDLTQEVFLRAFLLLERLNDQERFPAWIGRITRNLAIDWQRRGASRNRLAKQVSLDELPVDPADTSRPDIRDTIQQNRTSSILMEHIGKLDPHLREVVLLHFMEGLTLEKVGTIHGITPGAVSSRLKTALKHLRGALEPLLREGFGSMRAGRDQTARTILLVMALLALSEAEEAAAAVVSAAQEESPILLADHGPVGGSDSVWSYMHEAISVKPLVTAGVIGSLTVLGALSAWVGLGGSGRADTEAGFLPYRTDLFPGSAGSLPPAATPVAGKPGADPRFCGWYPFGHLDPAVAAHGYDPATGALTTTLRKGMPGLRQSGWFAPGADSLPMSAVGNDHFVRAKFFLFAAGQEHPGRPEETPNIALRVANRFAVQAELVVRHFRGDAPADNTVLADLRPSTDPLNPSLYRLDYAPVLVPYLRENATQEGIFRSYFALGSEPSMHGSINLAECVIGTYPSALAAQGEPVKVYSPALDGAGDLASRGTDDLVLAVRKQGRPLYPGGPLSYEEAEGPKPTYAEGRWGITLDTMQIPESLVGFAERRFWPGDDLAKRVRVEPDRQYKVRFHVTSTQASSANALVCLRARTANYGWVQNFEMLGAWRMEGGPGQPNNVIVQQALPGLGCGNPDKRTPGEPGGWYTVLLTSPLNAGLRPDFPLATPLSRRMPALMAEPGNGEPKPSLRDLCLDVELIDTYSHIPEARLERGNITVDRIEVHSAPLVSD